MKAISSKILRIAFSFLVFVRIASFCFAQDWRRVDPADLKATSEPGAPGADAVILYREEIHNDVLQTESHYVRIKILTQNGRDKWGAVEIPYRKSDIKIKAVQGRTIHSDGVEIPLQDEGFDTTALERRTGRWHTERILVRKIALPQVEVGSIIEYRYTLYWSEKIYAPTWEVQHSLYQREVSFKYTPLSFQHYQVMNPRGKPLNDVSMIAMLPPEIPQPSGFGMTIKNVAAFQEEDYMPPSDQVKGRVRFFYVAGKTNQAQTDKFWAEEGESWRKEVEKFIGRSGSIAAAAAAMVKPEETSDQKAQKIYAEVQKLENLSFTSSDENDAHSGAKSVDRVWEEKRGSSSDLTRLFVALARAAGLPAYVMHVSSRDRWLFERLVLDETQLNHEIAIVKLADGKEIFLDPGTKCCPYGTLEWKHTGVQGIRETDNGKTMFAETPPPECVANRTERIARLKLLPDGSLTGEIAIQFYGDEALQQRQSSLRVDERQRNQDLEDEIKEWLPSGSSVKLNASRYWDDLAKPLLVHFAVTIPNYASSAGQRLLAPAVLFHADNTLPFTHASRVQPVYFPFPYYDIDDVVIQMPETVQIEALPQPEENKTDFGTYILRISGDQRQLIFRRDFVMAGYVFPVAKYPDLRAFYEHVRNGDGEQAVLKVSGNSQTRK